MARRVKPKHRSVVAADLRTPKYKPRRVPNKKRRAPRVKQETEE